MLRVFFKIIKDIALHTKHNIQIIISMPYGIIKKNYIHEKKPVKKKRERQKKREKTPSLFFIKTTYRSNQS